MACQITHIGTATMVLEIGGLRLLTDPVFDPAGSSYTVGPGLRYGSQMGPAVPVSSVGRIDVVLLSHDHHRDNLDHTGETLLAGAGRVLTTSSGARRLATRLNGDIRGLKPWDSLEVDGPDGFRVRVTGTPARHGPPLSRPVVGDVTGFVLEWSGQQHGALYISGDTVWFPGIAETAKRFRVSTAVLHLGAARLGAFKLFRYTFSATEAVRAAVALGARTVIPIHYEGWSHFQEQRAHVERAFDLAGLAGRLQWLPLGVPTMVAV